MGALISKGAAVSISQAKMKNIEILIYLSVCMIILIIIVEAQPPPHRGDQFSTKRFRCLKKTDPLILGAIKKSTEYQEYDLAVSGHSLKETKEILKKMCDNHEQITQGHQFATESRHTARSNTKRFRLSRRRS